MTVGTLHAPLWPVREPKAAASPQKSLLAPLAGSCSTFGPHAAVGKQVLAKVRLLAQDPHMAKPELKSRCV